MATSSGSNATRSDVDRLDALAEERTKEWTRIGCAAFLTDDEKREAVGYGPRGGKTLEEGNVSAGEGGATLSAGSGIDPGANGGFWAQQPRDEWGQFAPMGAGGAQVAAGADIGSPVVLTDAEGDVLRNAYAWDTDKVIRYPSKFPPEFFMRAGENANPTNILSDLSKFDQGGEWDIQRLENGKVDPKYIDYATVAIGLYAAGAGIPRTSILDFQNWYAFLHSNFPTSQPRSTDYGNLLQRNVLNTNIGYGIYEAANSRR